MSHFNVAFAAIQKEEPVFESHGWIQWKGTDVCMDVHCKCGESYHIDASFFYAYKCVSCGRVYAVGQVVKLIELSKQQLADLGYNPITGYDD